ncbi:MAG: DinB family protein [Chloroflexota bacterium]
MDVKDYLRQTYDYTYWANRRYFAVAEGLTEEQLHRKQGHSWDDVHSVLLHMLSSEMVWLQRWQGESPKGHLDPKEYPTLEVLREAWARTEREMRAFIDQHTEQSLQREIAYANFSGERFRVPLWQMLMHIPNHETHHRGELAAMFALMNIPHPEEEVIQYFLDLSGQKKA